MNFLLLGYGSIGKRHTAILREMGHDVTTVDPDVNTNSDFATVWRLHDPKAPIGADYDGVLDCTPPDVRAGWGTSARARFIEKPLGDMLAASIVRRREPKMMGFSYRWSPRLEEFVKMIRQHTIYSLSIVGGQWLQDWHKEDYRDRRYWGVVLDSLPHSVYIARWILGELEYIGSVASKVSHLEINVEDTAAVLLKGPDDQPVLLQADYLRFPRAFYVEAQTSWPCWYRWEFAAKEADEMYRRQMAQFVRVCRGDKQAGYPDIEDGVAVQRILDAIKADN